MHPEMIHRLLIGALPACKGWGCLDLSWLRLRKGKEKGTSKLICLLLTAKS